MIGIMLTTKSWKSSPLKICRNFDRTLACAACCRSPMCTDVRLVNDETPVRQTGNIEVALMHRCSTAVLPGIVPTAEDGLHTSHDDA